MTFKEFFVWFLICMLCQSKFLIIPNSQGPEALNWLVSLISLTLDVNNRLFSQVLTQTQSLGTHIHFAISILYPFSTSLDPRYPHNLPSPTHTHASKCTHVCTCVDIYIHVYTPTDGRPVRGSPWSRLGSNITRDRPIRGVSIRVITSQRDPILSAVHTYMNTRIHTHHTCLYICELVRCSSIWIE